MECIQLKNGEISVRLRDYNNFVSVGLTAATGKDTFYEKFGFSKSLGMTKYIER